MQNSKGLKLLASLAALACFGSLAGQGIFGAFSAQTVNSANEFSSATLELSASNNAVAEPVYLKTNAVPGDRGDTDHSCIEITYSGTVPAEVRLFGRGLGSRRRGDHRLGRCHRLGSGLVGRDRGNRLRATTGTGRRQVLVELADALAQVGVLLDEPGQFGLHQVQEGVDLVLVVPPLADRRFAERDVMYVCRC
mgnify:CR=1 FL=1